MSDIKGNSISAIIAALTKFSHENIGNGRTISLTPEQAGIVALCMEWEYIIEHYCVFPSGGGCWSPFAGEDEKDIAEYMAKINSDREKAAFRVRSHSGGFRSLFGKHYLPEGVDPYTE